MNLRVPILLLGLLTSCTGTAGAIQPDPVYRETERRHSRPHLAGEVFDPQETDAALKDVFAAADRKAERLVASTPRDSQFIFHFWREKKRILSEEYGLQWHTPGELNPNIKYARYGQPEITEVEDRILRALAASKLSNATESIRGITRSPEGIASVWTRGAHRERIREYRFTGHDEHWTFVGVSEWEE